VIAFASYLAWFWLLTRYYAGRLAVFSFLAPLFGVAFGVWLLATAQPDLRRRRADVGAGIGWSTCAAERIEASGSRTGQ